MATSGNVYSSYANDSRFRLYWTRQSYSSITNKSTIKWTLYLVSDDYWYNNAVRIDNVYINGTKVKSSQTWSNFQHGTYTLASDTLEIQHNNDGTKTFSASLAGWFFSNHNVSGSGSFTLDPIPRYANPVLTVTAKTETSITVTWTADAVCDQIQFSSDNGSTWTAAQSIDTNTGSYTFTGLTVGTTYNLKAKARRKDSQLTNESAALSVATYSKPYANVTPDFIIGDTLTVSIENPLMKSVRVSLLDCNGTNIITASVSGNGAVTLIDETILGHALFETVCNALYASIPSATSAQYSIKVENASDPSDYVTVTGGTYAINHADCLPSLGTFSYADSNGTAVAITGDATKIVQNISTPTYTLLNVTGTKSATIAGAVVSVNNATVNMTVSGTTATGTGAVINSTADVTATVTVTDSRGMTASKSVTVSMVAWSAPTAIYTVERQSNFYTETDMKVDADYTQIGSSTITISVLGQAVPITGQTTPADVTATLTDNVQSTVNFDNNFAWNIYITLTDSFGGSTTYTTYISRGIPLVFFDRFKGSVGINQFPQHDNTLEVNGDIYADNLNADADINAGGDINITGDYKQNGNNLFPISVANGGTGQTTISDFINAIATEYTDSATRTGSTSYTKEFTASGSGIVFASISTACDGTSGSGACMAEVFLNGTWVAYDYTWLSSTGTPGIGANANAALMVVNGDKVSFTGLGTKAGTKTMKLRIVAIGCTLTSS